MNKQQGGQQQLPDFVNQQGGDQAPSRGELVEQPDHHFELKEGSMVALARNFPLFIGKSSEDVDLHVQQFAHYWKVAKPKDPAITEPKLNELKKDVFTNSFQKKSME